MKDKQKEKLQIVLFAPVLLICIWISISTLIQAIKNPELTQTELFLKIPKSFICEFD